MIPVNEIFVSIEGEGIRAGYPATFIRLYGCNLRCTYCDSMYSVLGGEFTRLTVDEVVDIVAKFGFRKVTLTGGEPMMHQGTPRLIKQLTDSGYEVNVETNGSIYLGDFRDIANDKVVWTMDYKSISSGQSAAMDKGNLQQLRKQDVLKFVVGTEEDLEDMKRVINEHVPTCHIFVSPIFGQIEPCNIVRYIMDNDLQGVRIQLQLHKYIWEPEMRGV